MRSRLLHAFFTITAFLAAWFVVTPAFADNATSASGISRAGDVTFASFAPPAPPPPAVPPNMRAPLCDRRGAITFAPPPQMQDVEVTLDTGLSLDDCMTSPSGALHRAAPGRAPPPLDLSSASVDSAIASGRGAAMLARASRELIPAPAASTPCSRPGFRSTVDRPPRV